jgi:hypothetical protein
MLAGGHFSFRSPAFEEGETAYGWLFNSHQVHIASIAGCRFQRSGIAIRVCDFKLARIPCRTE